MPQPTTLHPSLRPSAGAEGGEQNESPLRSTRDYDGDGPKMKCRCDPKAIESGSLAKPSPHRAVRIFSNRCERDGGSSDASLTDYFLALQTADGWRIESIVSLESRHYCSEGFTLDSLSESDVIPGGAREILIRWSQDYGCRTGEQEHHLSARRGHRPLGQAVSDPRPSPSRLRRPASPAPTRATTRPPPAACSTSASTRPAG